MKLTTAEQMKELDRQAIEERGIPSIDLMERAGGRRGRGGAGAAAQRPGSDRGRAACAARATTAAMESPQPGCCF